MASFFSPCSIGLIPAYLGFLLRSETEAVPLGESRPLLRRSLTGGLATAAGIVSLYAFVALLMWIAGPYLRPYVPYMGPVVAVGLVLLGIAMLAGFDWGGLGRAMGAGRVDGRRGFFAFGLGYGLAAFGCTGPAFLPILLAGFAESTLAGALVFLLYAVSIAGFVVLAALLTATGNQGSLRWVLSHTRTVSRVAASLMVVAGVYLFHYYGSALWDW